VVPEAALRVPFAANLHVDQQPLFATDLSLGTRPGYLAQLAVAYTLIDHWVVRVTAGYEESRLAGSPFKTVLSVNGVPVLAVREPSSKTEQIILAFGITYVFP